MKRTAGTELTNDATVTSHHDVTTLTSFRPFQQQQPVAIDVGNNVKKVMAGISDTEKDMHGTKT